VKLAARAVLSADAGLLVYYLQKNSKIEKLTAAVIITQSITKRVSVYKIIKRSITSVYFKMTYDATSDVIAFTSQV